MSFLIYIFFLNDDIYMYFIKFIKILSIYFSFYGC